MKNATKRIEKNLTSGKISKGKKLSNIPKKKATNKPDIMNAVLIRVSGW